MTDIAEELFGYRTEVKRLEAEVERLLAERGKDEGALLWAQTEINRLRAVVFEPLSSEEMRLIDKHLSEWVAFKHAWNAIMKHRQAALKEPTP